MTENDDLAQLRESLLDDETQRQRLLAGLGRELDAIEVADELSDERLAELLDSGELLYAPPAVADRMGLAARLNASQPSGIILLVSGPTD